MLRGLFALLGAASLAAPLAADAVHPLPYPIVYVRAPYFGPTGTNSVWPDTVRPLIPDPGAQLVLLRPDGVRDVLFPLERYRAQIDTPPGSPLSAGSVADPNVSFDGEWVLFTWYHDLTDRNPQRDGLSYAGADLYKLHLGTRELVRLTHQEFTPNTGNGASFDPGNPNSNYPRVGVFNTGGAWAPGGAIVFTSSRNNLLPPKQFTAVQRVLQLFRMDADGANVEPIGHLNLGMALHPQVLLDGRVAFSSWEMQGIRDARDFPLWAIGPDGRGWTSLSGFSEFALVHHFMTQMPGGDLVVCRYYNLNNNGFGDLVRYPIDPPGPDFGTADPVPGSGTIPFERVGQQRLTPFTTPDDFPAPCPGWEDNPYGSAGAGHCAGADRRGKFTHPAATPSVTGGAAADLLAVYAPGPANHNGIWAGEGTTVPLYHGEIVLLPDGAAIPIPPAGTPGRPPQLVSVLAEDGFNLQWPRPVVRYRDLFGVDEPAAWPQLQDSEIAAEGMTPGEPFGEIGTSSLIWRDTEPAQALSWQPDRDPFNESREFQYGWIHQGADAGVYGDDDLWAVRILMQQAQTDRSYPDNGANFSVVGGERMRILGEVPVRGPDSGKPGSPTTPLPDGRTVADTSFLVRVPADTSITFQALDSRGMVLDMAQTWHQVRPGEARYDCGGCHAHSKTPVDFGITAASQPSYSPRDLARTTPLLALDGAGQPIVTTIPAHRVAVEYFHDVRPLLDARCAACHGGATPAAGLDLSSAHAPVGGFPYAYWRLVQNDEGTYLEPQLTRYLRAFQSRQSLLLWKVWGARLDGRANGDRADDLDYAASAEHPNGVGVAGMTYAEKITLARWVDVGAPIDLGAPWGFLEDDLRPTLVLGPSLAAAASAGSIATLRVAAFDVESGVDPATLAVTCDRTLGAFPPGSNLAVGQALDAEGAVLLLTLPAAVATSARPTFTVRVADHAGHRTEIRRTYGGDPALAALFADGFEIGSTALWSAHLP
jgi:hypothetical protein